MTSHPTRIRAAISAGLTPEKSSAEMSRILRLRASGTPFELMREPRRGPLALQQSANHRDLTPIEYCIPTRHRLAQVPGIRHTRKASSRDWSGHLRWEDECRSANSSDPSSPD